MKMNRYVFDLDNTLVYTDLLNNESYNYALRMHGINWVSGKIRITRELVSQIYPNIVKLELDEIIRLKQDYFVQNMHKIELNKTLQKLLISANPDFCLLWTSADKCRTESILNFFELTNCFVSIFYSYKTDLKSDILRICDIMQCESSNLAIYEDSQITVKILRELNINVMQI